MGILENSGLLCAGTSNLRSVRGGKRSTIREDFMAVLSLMQREFGGGRLGRGYYASLFVEIKNFHTLSFEEVLAGCDLFDVDEVVPFGYRKDIDALHAFVALEAVKVADDGRWDPRGPEMVRKLAAVALADSIGRGACSVCDGVRTVASRGGVVTCRKCRGSGRKLGTGQQYSELLGVSPASWSEPWSWRYVGIMNILSDFEGVVDRVAMRELFGD